MMILMLFSSLSDVGLLAISRLCWSFLGTGGKDEAGDDKLRF